MAASIALKSSEFWISDTRTKSVRSDPGLSHGTPFGPISPQSGLSLL
jgi:hypothetical protein